MRPIYETPQDLKNENEVVAYLSAAWGCNFVKLKISYGLDFAIMKDGGLVATSEIKCRNYDSAAIDRFGGLMLSASKAHRAAEWMANHGAPLVLAVKLKDGLFVATIEQWKAYELKFTGRTDRGDWQDVEPCCIIPMSEFEKMDMKYDPAP
jgi:hypothetical protein